MVAVNTEESQTVLSFDDWLASVTERINQTMHYQFDGLYTQWNALSVWCIYPVKLFLCCCSF